MIKAAKRFDETRGFKFISFAVWWIRQSILSAIAEHTRMIRLPRNNINLLTSINRAAAELENQLKRQPTDEEMAEFLGIVSGRISEVRGHASRTISYDTSLTAEDDFPQVQRWAMERTISKICYSWNRKRRILRFFEKD